MRAAAFLALLLGGLSAAVLAKDKATIYTASNIVTMDSERPNASAVAVSQGRIVSVGDLKSVKSELRDYTVEVDDRFAKQVILPGLIEKHLHPTLAGILLPSTFITPWDWSLPNQEVKGVQNKADYLASLKQALSTAPKDKVFITWGYHQYFHGELNREDLDELAPELPVIVWHRSFHEIILNTAAMGALQLDLETLKANPAIDLDKGHFWELGLFAIFPKLQPLVLNPERYRAGVLEGFIHAQQNGITTVADQGFPLLNFQMELSQLDGVLKQSQIPLDVHIVGNGKTLSLDGVENGLKLLQQLPAASTDHVKFLPKQVKLLADGAFYSQLMQMEDGYLDGHHGEWITPPEELETSMRSFWNDGNQLHIHVNGDKGLNVVLDILEKLIDESPRDHRTVLHHYGYSGADHAERLAELGVSVSANPYYFWALADKYGEVGMGPERAQYIARLGDLERNNVSVSLHSDLPMAPASPLRLAGIAASRITGNGNALTPDERLSVSKALRSITIDAAKAIQLDGDIGSIEVGKRADFTLLAQDPTEVSPVDWQNINVLGIVKDGTIHLQ